MSDGLIPPLNAPPAGAAVPGIQPGNSLADIAQVVIVFGPSGTPSGVFVYQPGTAPGPGNPPTSGMTSSTTDPFGNPVPFATAGQADLFVQTAGGTGAYILMTSGDAESDGPAILFSTRAAIEDPTFGPAGLFETTLNTGAANESILYQLGSPEIKTPNNQFALVNLVSSANDGSQTAFGTLVYGDDSTSQKYQVAIWGNGGLFIPVCNRLVGQTPGATVPTPATWQNMSPLAAGFNVTGNNFNGDPTYAEYTWEPMGPSGSVHIRGNINVTAGPGNAFKLLTGTSLIAGHRPSQPRYFPVSFNLAAVASGSNNCMGMGVIEPSGAIFVFGGASAVGDSCLIFEATIRLD